MLEPLRELAKDPPRLCEAGPCAHYHRFCLQVDAENPKDERRPDGTVIHHGRVFHVQTHHYCYPDVGIETNLGALPVLACNRWVPIGGLIRRVFKKAALERAFEREVAAWKAREDREVSRAALAAEVYPLRLSVVVRWPASEQRRAGGKVIEVDAKPSWAVHLVAEAAFAELDLDPKQFWIDEIERLDDPRGAQIGNLKATLEQLGITATKFLLVTVTEDHKETTPP